MERKEVYEILDSERDYQESRWGTTLSSNRPGKGERTIDEFILYIKGYADKLSAIGATESDPNVKLDFVRKVGGLCVNCMEQHGGKKRELQNV